MLLDNRTYTDIHILHRCILFDFHAWIYMSTIKTRYVFRPYMSQFQKQ